MNITLLSIAILPVIVLAITVYIQDRYEKEPLPMLLKAFFFGVLCIPLAILLESALSSITFNDAIADGAYTGFVVAGCSEELCKLLFLTLAVWRSRAFNEYFDGIVYATFVSLGFACCENISYIFGAENFTAALTTGSVRAILSVPGHFLFGVVMGYYFALAKFQPQHRVGNFLKAFFVPMLLHGTFDTLLMIPNNLGNTNIISIILFGAFVYFDIILWRIGRRRLRRLQELSSTQNTEQNSTPPNNEDKPFDNIDWNV